MSSIMRRAALAIVSLAVCVALIAIAPRALPQPQAAAVAGPTELPTLAPETPTLMVAAQRYALSEGQSLSIISLDGQSSPQESLALELIPTPEIKAPVGEARAPARPAVIPGYGPEMRGKLTYQTGRIDIYVGSNTFSRDEVAQYAWKLEALLRENEVGFFSTKLERRISIGFYSKGSAPDRGTRGIAYTSEGRIEVYFAGNEDITSAFTIAAHEMAHQLQYERYGEAVHSRSDMVLLEGMATWVSGVRWLKEYGVPSWRGRAFQLHGQGIPLMIAGAQRYGADNSYELWASFISYIYKTYGMETVDALYRSSRGRAIGSADYQGVTGKSLKELTAAWREWVLAYEPPPSPTPSPIPTPETPTPTPRKAGK
jgi:hypothetical protein